MDKTCMNLEYTKQIYVYCVTVNIHNNNYDNTAPNTNRLNVYVINLKSEINVICFTLMLMYG